MLYATVRNRKISVKKPTTIPCNGRNVDFLTLDLDDEWQMGIESIVCTFCNDYFESKTQKKTTKVTTKTTTEETPAAEEGDDAATTTSPVTSSVTTTNTEVTYEDMEDVEEKSENEYTEDSNTTTKTESEDDETGKKTTVEETIVTTVKIVETTEAKDIKRSVICRPGEEVKIPVECIQHPGQLSVWLTGFSVDKAELEGIEGLDETEVEAFIEALGENTTVRTMAVPDSFWELEENGEPEWTASEEETATLHAQVLGLAEAAAEIARTLEAKAAAKEFNGENGKDGATPKISIGSVETTEAGGEAQVTASGTTTDVKLNFKLPRGQAGTDGKDGADGKDGENGKDGYTPQKGVDYWTDEDKAEIVNNVLAALPNGDEVEY